MINVNMQVFGKLELLKPETVPFVQHTALFIHCYCMLNSEHTGLRVYLYFIQFTITSIFK